ncbi:MAG: hypothetical protein QOJ00_979 [Actinomycetota bacterium]|jgi:uncharacterized membrane protein HdeD (DUF308 family)
MIAGATYETDRDDARWENAYWTRYLLWLFAAGCGLSAGFAIAESRIWLCLLGAFLASTAIVAALGITRRDDRGWWLALGLLGVVAVQAVVFAAVKWDASWLLQNVLAFAGLWALRHPPAYPWRKQLRQLSSSPRR